MNISFLPDSFMSVCERSSGDLDSGVNLNVSEHSETQKVNCCSFIWALSCALWPSKWNLLVPLQVLQEVAEPDKRVAEGAFKEGSRRQVFFFFPKDIQSKAQSLGNY